MNEVARFREAATSLCRLIETADQIQPVEFLRRASGLLAAVYSAAVGLPNPNTDASWEGDDLFRVEDWAAIQSTLQAKLDGIDKYRFVFYPDPEVKDEPIVSSISFGLAEIYVDLKQALARDDSDEALWQTRFYFDHHWGRHLADVLHPIHWAAWDG